MAPPPSELIGTTGRRYLFKQLIQERLHLGRVWLATCEHTYSHHVAQVGELTVLQIRTRQIRLEGHSQGHFLEL